MELILCNFAGKFRYETLNGRTHLVAAVTMIVPGVLNGSSGALYYSPKVTVANVDSWNGMPIVVYHPQFEGRPISARDPDILNNQGVGVVLRAKDAEGNLQAEAWFDVEEVKRVDNSLADEVKILPRLIAGSPIELSTGLKTIVTKAPEGAVHNSKPYEYVVEATEPDHLAILPDQIGACSLEDGCGVFATNTANKIAEWQKALQKMIASKGKDGMTLKTENKVRQMSFDQIRDALCDALRSRFTQDEPSAWVSEVYEDHIIYWQGDDLFQLSYTLLADGVLLSSDTPVRVEREVTFVPVENEGDSSMPMSAADKTKLIGNLIQNSCGCWKKGDEKLLEGFTDEKLNELATANATHRHQLTVVNALTKGITVGDRVVQYDPKGKSLKVRVTNEGEDTVEGEGGDDSLPVEGEETVSGGSGADTTANRGGALSEAEYIRQMPPSVRKTFENARRVENTEKARIVQRLIANADDSKKQAIAKRYMAKDLPELQELLELMPQQTDNGAASGEMFFGFPVAPNFFGQQGGTHTSNAADDEANDILELPTEAMLA